MLLKLLKAGQNEKDDDVFVCLSVSKMSPETKDRSYWAYQKVTMGCTSTMINFCRQFNPKWPPQLIYSQHTFTDIEVKFGVVMADKDSQHIVWALTNCTKTGFKHLSLNVWSQLMILLVKLSGENNLMYVYSWLTQFKMAATDNWF